MSWCVKVDTLGRLCDDDLERSYIHFTTTTIYFIGTAYNFYFLIIYKPSTLIISPQTFSTQLGAGTAWFCLSQCAIPFCTLSSLYSLSLLLICTVVSQVTLLSSYNSEATVSSLCSLPVPILFEFLLNFSRKCVKKAAWSVLSQQPSSHVWSCIHSRQGFHPGLWPGLRSLC